MVLTAPEEHYRTLLVRPAEQPEQHPPGARACIQQTPGGLGGRQSHKRSGPPSQGCGLVHFDPLRPKSGEDVQRDGGRAQHARVHGVR